MAVIGFCDSCQRTTYVGDHEERACPSCGRTLSQTRLEPGRAKVIGLNESRFRSRNEDAAEADTIGSCPVVCECGVVGCAEPIGISTEAYNAVRAHPARFVVVRGHVIPEAETVVENGGDYVVVEKTGEARKHAVAEADTSE